MESFAREKYTEMRRVDNPSDLKQGQQVSGD
jgi:hypothetical protein